MVKFRLVDNLNEIQTERERIQPLMKEYPYLKWIPRWLAKTDEEHFIAGDDCLRCEICGEKPRQIVYADLPFCDECNLGIGFCKPCLRRLTEL